LRYCAPWDPDWLNEWDYDIDGNPAQVWSLEEFEQCSERWIAQVADAQANKILAEISEMAAVARYKVALTARRIGMLTALSCEAARQEFL